MLMLKFYTNNQSETYYLTYQGGQKGFSWKCPKPNMNHTRSDFLIFLFENLQPDRLQVKAQYHVGLCLFDSKH